MGAEGASVQLLGGLSVRLRGQDVTAAIGGRVGQLAFAYLVLRRDRAVRRDELAAAIWEESAPADPDAALRVVLTRLRKALGAGAIAGRSELHLVLPEPVEVDVELLRRDDGSGPGPGPDTRELLPGLDADWITAERALLSDLRTNVLLSAGRSALEANDLDGAEQTARRLIALAPFRETGYRLLMESLAAQDEVAEALRAYEDFRLLLREELATSPSRELATLHTTLLRAGEESDRPTGATSDHLALPAPASPAGRPALAGRRRELDRLEEIRTAAAETGPTRVLLGGEPGIGKSRLASELAHRAQRGGWNVLWGRCHEAALVPYEPWVEALRQYAAALSNQQLAELAHSAGTEFLALAPDLARRLPRAALAPVADDPAARRYRLFESVAELLMLAAGARPLILIIEDMHWADQGTILLLTHVLTRPGAVPLLVVGTYRTNEVPPGHPLLALPEGEELAVGGLTPTETAQIVGELAPGSPLADRVHAETEGNPLFVLESLRALLESGAQTAVPGGIREVIDRRLRRVGRDADTVLGAGAVLGRSFSVGEVSRVTGLSQERLLDAVDESIAAGLIEETPGTADGLAFSHALIREVRYAQHSRPRLTALHEAAAEALRLIYGGDLADHLADLATHLEAAARDQTSARAAVEALRQAGEQAGARQAFEDAVDWLERAAALFELARPSDAGRCDVLLSLAEALRASDRIQAAREAAADAAAFARQLSDPERLARAAFAFVGSHLVFKAGRPDAQDIGLLEEAVEAVLDTGAIKVRLMVRLCTAIYYSDRFDEVSQIARRALETARRSGDEDALGWALYAHFWDGLAPDRAAQAQEAMRQLRPIAQRTQSVELASESAMVEWYGLLRQGRPDLLAAELTRSRKAIIRTGVPIYRWFADAIGAMLAVTQGRFTEAEALIAEVARNGAAIDPHDLPRFATMPMIQLLHHQGRLGELVQPLSMVVANNPGLPVWRGVLLEALVAGGDQAEAERLLAELATEDFRWLRRDVNWLWAITAISSACVGLRDARVAEVLYRLLSAIPDQSVVCGPALGFLGPVIRYTAPLAALIGRFDEARQQFRTAVAQLEAVGAIPLAQATQSQCDQLVGQAETSP
jgi:DNA-binding SARP family transcriptional activator